MFFDKYLPLRLTKNHKPLSKSKEKNNSPYRIQPKFKNENNQKNDIRKRIMTECDQDIDPHKVSKSTIGKPKRNLFLQDVQEYSKEKSNDRFLKRFQKNNFFVVQSTKHNQSKNTNLKTVYGGTKIPKRKNTTMGNKDYPIGGLAKLDRKKVKKIQRFQNTHLSINHEETKKSISRQKTQKQKKQQKPEKNLLQLDKLNINIEKQNDRKSIKQQNTVQTVKKRNQTINTNQQQMDRFDLTQEQFVIFGDRFPYGFQKIKLLGRGGFSLVWLGQHKKSTKLFAIKQIITQNNHQTHMKQIWFGSIFFTLGGLPRPEFSKHIGIKNLAKMYSYQINQTDTWIFYQKCGNSLGNSLYEIRGEKFNNEKVYKIHYKPLYTQMINDVSLLKTVVIEVCKALQLLSENLIVHSDLKTENILIKYDEESITEVKLIDYGSSFSFTQINQFSMATPEYMSHEILNYILCENENDYDEQLLKKVKNYKNPWVIDIWSLGCVILQLINGIPLWMSLPLLVQQNGQYEKRFGLFAVKGRVFQKIIDKQVQVIENLDHYLIEQNYSGIELDTSLVKVLKGMLQLQPQQRMSPKQVIEILTYSL